jgi:LmbE family N-acetylglucosaminyl deacetylase
MLELELHRKAQNILCLGAHADDIEIGCGGTLLKWISQRPDLNIYWAVFSAEDSRADEARASAEGILQKVSHNIAVHFFRTSFLPFEGSKVKDCFEEIKDSFAPDIIFTHHRDDRHQDHRLLADLTWNTFRNHLVLEYEIPKYDGDLGAPNLFVTLDEELARQKVTHLCRFFQTQANKHWFAQETFFALMRLRGMECAAHYAEAFYCRKLLLA